MEPSPVPLPGSVLLWPVILMFVPAASPGMVPVSVMSCPAEQLGFTEPGGLGASGKQGGVGAVEPVPALV